MAVLDAGQDRSIGPLTFNNFEVRLAQTTAEVEAAQALRFAVFYGEMHATPSPEVKARGLDCDAFDPICDHLIVVDLESDRPQPFVVGTYRLLRRSVAAEHGGFLSAQEYDLSALLDNPGESVEVGRACVHADYRTRGVLQLLWRGLAAYVIHHGIDLMFGTASFPGTDPREMQEALAYLHHYHRAPSDLRPRALEHHYVEMGSVPRSGVDVQAAVAELPPLIKGYLRLGGFVGDGAVVDRQFNTTDVCMIVKTDQMSKKYDRHYRRASPDEAAA